MLLHDSTDNKKTQLAKKEQAGSGLIIDGFT